APPRSAVALIARALRRHQRLLACGFPLILCWQLCETLVPVVIGFVIDHGIASGDGRRLVESLLVLVVLFLVLATAYRFGSRFVMRGIETEAHLLRMEITSHVLHPQGARTDQLPGEVQALATSDAALVPTVFRQLGFAIASLTS